MRFYPATKLNTKTFAFLKFIKIKKRIKKLFYNFAQKIFFRNDIIYRKKFMGNISDLFKHRIVIKTFCGRNNNHDIL